MSRCRRRCLRVPAAVGQQSSCSRLGKNFLGDQRPLRQCGQHPRLPQNLRNSLRGLCAYRQPIAGRGERQSSSALKQTAETSPRPSGPDSAGVSLSSLSVPAKRGACPACDGGRADASTQPLSRTVCAQSSAPRACYHPWLRREAREQGGRRRRSTAQRRRTRDRVEVAHHLQVPPVARAAAVCNKDAIEGQVFPSKAGQA